MHSGIFVIVHKPRRNMTRKKVFMRKLNVKHKIILTMFALFV